ncbi:MAG: tetratricopeptide repeat protein [Candidatus Acidiferrales bacterium]
MRSPVIPKFSKKFSAPVIFAAIILLFGATAVPTTLGQSQADATETGVNVEASQQIFATMCALDAAGFGADESTLAEMPSRLALRGELLKLQGPATDALRQYYRDHALADPGETLSRYIAFALVVGPPPRFAFLMDQETLPPDVLVIQDFEEVLANFYHEAHLDLRWSKVEPEYARAVDRSQSPVRRIVTVCNGYLREIYKARYGRSFTVYVEPLVGNRANFRNNGDHYAIVIGAGAEFPTDDVRHAYLHYMLDPLPLKYRDALMRKSGLLNIGARAPLLPPEYKSDFIAYADECFVKAVELRIRHLSPEKHEAALVDDDRSGFIMVRVFDVQLQKFEKAEPAMSLYFPDLLGGIDVPAEQKRYANFKFATLEETPAPETAANATPAQPGQQPDQKNDPQSERDRLLAEGDHQIALQDAPAAIAAFQKVLAKNPDDARANFGLAIASLLNHDADHAEELFEKLVSAPSSTGGDAVNSTSGSDPAILAWSHVYLGRLHDFAEERDQALTEYRAALAIAGAPEAARVAAQRGIDTPYNPRGTGGANGPQKP